MNMKIFIFCFLAFCAGLVCGYYKSDYDHPAFCSELEARLYKERLKYHGLDRRFNSVWKENGKWYFRDEKGRTGRFI